MRTTTLHKLFQWALLCVTLSVGIACTEQLPMVSLGLNEHYDVYRMNTLHLTPGFTGSSYRWIQHLPGTRDSIVCTTRDFYFLQAQEGDYHYTFQIVDSTVSYEHSFTVEVQTEWVAYSPYIASVFEYQPAPGQFVNTMPAYEEGDTKESMRKKAEECISGTNDVMISLGAFGGYVTFAFDHTVCNVKGCYDFLILGNTFYSDLYGNKEGGSAEPGIVEVAFDRNGNGKPDEDEWYELAGSAYDSLATLHHYEITYHRPSSGHVPTSSGFYTDTEHIRWTDNRGNSGYIPQNMYHRQNYFPQWTTTDSLTFCGTRLPDNAVDESGHETYYVLYSYAWGYADNQINSRTDLNSFDIGWAVDRNGKPVELPGADFIRVYTAVNQCCGWLGETSTEIMRAQDLHLSNNVKN